MEIGWITVGTGTLFDLSAVLPHQAIAGAPEGVMLLAGQFLRALFGYSSRPETATFIVWALYVATALAAFLRPVRPAVAATRPSPGTSAAS